MVPLYLFSLPRSGSTMSQMILGAHEAIYTVSEPYLLLPYLYTLKDKGVYSEFSHQGTKAAIEDFCHQLPKGKEDYLTGIRELVLGLYLKAAKSDVKYFLDKTPRYHLVVEDILRLFPDGKYIFLWRNPLAVAASMINWANGRWDFHLFKIDLFEGLANLVAAYEKHENRAISVRYEDLVVSPRKEWEKIFKYLGLPFDTDTLSRFEYTQLEGQMGDPTGSNATYQTVSVEPLQKWKKTLNNPLRKAWCRRYLKWIGKDRLKVMGYDLHKLISDLDAISNSPRYIGSDLMRIIFFFMYYTMDLRIVFKNLKTIPQLNRMYGHD